MKHIPVVPMFLFFVTGWLLFGWSCMTDEQSVLEALLPPPKIATRTVGDATTMALHASSSTSLAAAVQKHLTVYHVDMDSWTLDWIGQPWTRPDDFQEGILDASAFASNANSKKTSLESSSSSLSLVVVRSRNRCLAFVRVPKTASSTIFFFILAGDERGPPTAPSFDCLVGVPN